MDNDYQLPPQAERDYESSPVGGKPLIEQIEYWRDRCRFFEEKAYEGLRIIKELQEQRPEEDNSADWWKNGDE